MVLVAIYVPNKSFTTSLRFGEPWRHAPWRWDDELRWHYHYNGPERRISEGTFEHKLTVILFYRQDANIAGQATGAMSWAFITALKKNPQQSYVQLLNSIRTELEGRYSQKPQLSCSHPLGMYSSIPANWKKL